MRNLLVPQSAIEFNDRKWFQADTSQLYQDTRNWNLKHFSSGEEKKMAIKLQRRYYFLHIFVILLPCIHSASFAFAYLIRGYYHLWCILFCKLKMEDDTEEMGYYHLLSLMVHPILHSLYSCNSGRVCCFISYSHYFIHPAIHLCHIVSFFSSRMCVLLRMREVSAKYKDFSYLLLQDLVLMKSRWFKVHHKTRVAYAESQLWSN